MWLATTTSKASSSKGSSCASQVRMPTTSSPASGPTAAEAARHPLGQVGEGQAQAGDEAHDVHPQCPEPQPTSSTSPPSGQSTWPTSQAYHGTSVREYLACSAMRAEVRGVLVLALSQVVLVDAEALPLRAVTGPTPQWRHGRHRLDHLQRRLIPSPQVGHLLQRSEAAAEVEGPCRRVALVGERG